MKRYHTSHHLAHEVIKEAREGLKKSEQLRALKIKELATQHAVPVVENKPLARTLYTAVDVEEDVPPEHYKAVAEVISYVFTLRRTRV